MKDGGQIIDFLLTFTRERLEELRTKQSELVVSITTVDGTVQTVNLLEELPEGLIVRRQGGRIDLILWSSLSHIQLSTIRKEWELSQAYLAPGNKVEVPI